MIIKLSLEKKLTPTCTIGDATSSLRHFVKGANGYSSSAIRAKQR